MAQYVCGTITTGSGSTGVSVEVKKNGQVVATPTAYKISPGSFMYSTPVDAGAGFTTKATCDDCSQSAESSPPETVDVDEWQVIDVTISGCTC